MRIGELANLAGVTPKTLRFYEDAGLLADPVRTPAGYRDYPESAVGRVRFIKQAQSAGLTLAQVGQVLRIRDGGQPPCTHVAGLVETRLEEVTARLEELERIRAELLALHARVSELDPARCRDDDICAAISRP